MKSIIGLSLIVIATLHAEEVLEDISITEKGTTQVVKDISGEQLKNADLAEALQRNVPSISLVRRNGIANDIILRGQKRDNINVTIDGVKIYGAGPNRMDPPTSHVVTNTIDEVIVQEGPFDVEEFGALSGSIKIKTKKPSKEVHGDLSINAGSFGYQKASGTISGGTDKVRFLFSASKERGDQYEDGDGNNFAEQLSNYLPSTSPLLYSDEQKDREAFQKTMYMGKVFIDLTSDQSLELSYTANRSDNILFPSTPMDAIADDSDILNMKYSVKNLSEYSKKLDFQLYNSKVDHPMSNEYRVQGTQSYLTHALTSSMTGIKLKNSVDAFGQEISYGIDGSKRNWDGAFNLTTRSTGAIANKGTSIDNVDTKNVGLFIKSKQTIGQVDVEMGARYDDTSIDTKSSIDQDNKYNALSANIFASYHVDEDTKYFAGLGKSSRVPDARELYFRRGIVSGTQKVIGTSNLNQTTNYELDMGVEKEYEDGSIKFKTFYSKLKDYIYFNSSLAQNNFENIDASIYGAELSGMYMPQDDLYLSAGLAYKQGRKDSLTTGQSSRNLAEITPLKLTATASYDYDEQGNVELSLIAANQWNDIDSENGEQVLAGYGIFNFKTTREFNNGLELSLGIDNIFDRTYAITNTYKDLTLVDDGSTNMLMNEPGRYAYLNVKYQF